MNSNKMDFIVCYNDEVYFRECMDYISWLKVPEGMETEVIGISGADSMASGYNAAMCSSDAKYKVYLHQDVLILNENFIQDVVTVFRDNPEYGLLGIVGNDIVIKDGRYWQNWNTGGTMADNRLKAIYVQSNNPPSLKEVVAVDGMIMMTQYDVKWREDVFRGFHFYDVSQSFEFIRAGYKVGVVHQETYWCEHVCGATNIGNYDMNREQFCAEYAKEGHEYTPNVSDDEYNIRSMTIESKMPLLFKALEDGNIIQLTEYMKAINFVVYFNNQLRDLYVLWKIIIAEVQNDIQAGFCRDGMSYDILSKKLIRYKFLMKRIERDKPIDNLRDVFDEIVSGDGNGLEAEKVIAEHSVAKDRRIIWKLKRMVENDGGKKLNVSYEYSGEQTADEKRFGDILRNIDDIQKVLDWLEGNYEDAGDEQNRQMVDSVLDAMEYVYSDMHIGPIDEDIYTAYFDVAENGRNIQMFITYCRQWIDKVRSDIDGYMAHGV